jgi:hypothetical protein
VPSKSAIAASDEKADGTIPDADLTGPIFAIALHEAAMATRPLPHRTPCRLCGKPRATVLRRRNPARIQRRAVFVRDELK